MLQGGILTETIAQQRRNAGLPAGVVDETWGWMGETAELFFFDAPHWHVFTWDSVALLIRGVARTRDCPATLDLERVAEDLRCQYLERGQLPIEELEGSYTVALLDGHAQRVLLYRSLLSSAWTYYHANADGLIFGDHVRDVMQTALVSPRMRTAALPTYLVFGHSLGSETMFDGIERLLPGEQLCWERGTLTRSQRETFASLAERDDGPTHLELVLADVLADRTSLDPRLGVLLSGGPNSRLLQEVFTRVSGQLLPPSFSANVNHPLDWANGDEAMRASRTLGTKHHLTELPRELSATLVDFVARTGEVPDLSSLLYFDALADSLARSGLHAGISAIGGGALFAEDIFAEFDALAKLERMLPFRFARRTLKALASAVGATTLASQLWLIDHGDDVTSPLHPLNQLDAVADTDTLRELFGKTMLRRIQADRRLSLDRLGAPRSPTARLRALHLFGATMTSASLATLVLNRRGLDLCCPFLDSRVARLSSVLNAAPNASTRRLQNPPRSQAKANRQRMMLQALAPGGELAPLVAEMDVPELLDARTMDRLRQDPSPMLYRLLCFDLWHKAMLETTPTRREPSPVEQPKRRLRGVA